jgi:hypothetical protein
VFAPLLGNRDANGDVTLDGDGNPVPDRDRWERISERVMGQRRKYTTAKQPESYTASGLFTCKCGEPFKFYQKGNGKKPPDYHCSASTSSRAARMQNVHLDHTSPSTTMTFTPSSTP